MVSRPASSSSTAATRRTYLEGFTIDAMDEVDDKISKHPRGSAKRKAMERLKISVRSRLKPSWMTQGASSCLPKLRDKIDLDGMARFVSHRATRSKSGSPKPTMPASQHLMMDGYDPDIDPSVYLDGDLA